MEEGVWSYKDVSSKPAIGANMVVSPMGLVGSIVLTTFRVRKGVSEGGKELGQATCLFLYSLLYSTSYALLFDTIVAMPLLWLLLGIATQLNGIFDLPLSFHKTPKVECVAYLQACLRKGIVSFYCYK